MADAGRPLQLHHAPSSLAQGDQEEASRILSQRQQWAKEMRLIFSPKDMIFEDGSLNPEYVELNALMVFCHFSSIEPQMPKY